MSSRRSTAVAILVSLGVVALVVFGDRIQRDVRHFLVGELGDVAVARMQRLAADDDSDHMAAAEMITLPILVSEPAPGIFAASGVGNTFVIRTDDGDIIFDTGLIIQAAKQYDLISEQLDSLKPVKIFLSHSHADHVGGVRIWSSPETELVASSEFLEEQRYLTELNPYLHQRNRMLFPWLPDEPRELPGMNFRGLKPDTVVERGRPLRFTQGGRVFEVCVATWRRGGQIICCYGFLRRKFFCRAIFSDLSFRSFPNIFTMRGEKVRKPIEYIESLNTVINFAPRLILPSHLVPVQGSEQIVADLVRIRDAVQWVHDQTVAGMNEGKTVGELMEDIRLPPQLSLAQTHGKVSWAVKSIWEYYATWFHFDRTSELYATPQSAVLADLASAIDHAKVTVGIDAAIERREWERALHLLELLEGDEILTEALKSRWITVVRALRERALANEKNDYELYWLDAQLRRLEQ